MGGAKILAPNNGNIKIVARPARESESSETCGKCASQRGTTQEEVTCQDSSLLSFESEPYSISRAAFLGIGQIMASLLVQVAHQSSAVHSGSTRHPLEVMTGRVSQTWRGMSWTTGV